MDFFPGQSSHSLAKLSSAFQILSEEVHGCEAEKMARSFAWHKLIQPQSYDGVYLLQSKIIYFKVAISEMSIASHKRNHAGNIRTYGIGDTIFMPGINSLA